MRIVVTSGATREAIDGVRFITNFSTGSTGAALTDAFRAAGHSVLYLHGEGAAMPARRGQSASFSGFDNLDSALRRLLSGGKFDAVVHLAAVSDYSVASVIVDGKEFPSDASAKLDSGRDMAIRLRRNFKIVDRLSGYAAGKPPFVAAFKLTCTRSATKRKEAASRLSLAPGVGLAVHNDMLDMRAGRRIFTIYRKGGAVRKCASLRALAAAILLFAKENVHASCP